MSRITKSIAESTAKKLVKTKREVIASLENQLSNEVQKQITSKIPLDIIQFQEKYPKFITTSSTVIISGNGWNFERVYLNKYLPSPNSSQFEFLPNPKIANRLLLIFNEIKDKKTAIEELQNDLENTIFNLRTYKSVQENFPEAYELLPKIANNSVQLNLSDIRNRLNN